MSKAYKESSSADYTPLPADNRPGMMDLFAPAPVPQTELGRYRLLSPSAGIRVSPICLGAMSLGDQWTGWMGGKGPGQKESEELLDAFVEMGGNFIDTANNYQDEQSEHIIGEWMEKRGNRNDIVLATKFTTYAKNRNGQPYPGIGINWAGNHKKSLKVSLDESLRKLRTDYIDLLYVHWWEYSTSIPELMQSLNDVVRAGKVLYLGISDTPAWVVSQANEYARQNGMAQFVVYQGLWNLSARDMERDIIPMCRANNMSIAPWGVLGQGKYKTPEELKSRAQLRGGGPPSDDQIKLCEVLQEVANEVGGGAHLAGVAMAWARYTMTDCYPILGGTSIEQLKQNVDALSIKLTEEQVKKLDEASPFSHGFPAAFFGRDPRTLPGQEPESALMKNAGTVKYNPWP